MNNRDDLEYEQTRVFDDIYDRMVEVYDLFNNDDSTDADKELGLNMIKQLMDDTRGK